MKKNKWLWIIGSLGFFTSAARLTQAAQASEAKAAFPEDLGQPAGDPGAGLQWPKNFRIVIDQQIPLKDALQDLRRRFGDDVLKRLVLKFDGEQLKVVGIQDDGPEEILSKNPTTL